MTHGLCKIFRLSEWFKVLIIFELSIGLLKLRYEPLRYDMIQSDIIISVIMNNKSSSDSRWRHCWSFVNGIHRSPLKGCNAERRWFLCYQFVQAVGAAVELVEISGNMTIMWHPCNGINSICIYTMKGDTYLICSALYMSNETFVLQIQGAISI